METPFVTWEDSTQVNWEATIHKKISDAFVTQNVVIKQTPGNRQQYQYAEQWRDKPTCIDNFSADKSCTGTQWWGCLWVSTTRIENEVSHPEYDIMQKCSGGLPTSSEMQNMQKRRVEDNQQVLGLGS